jgi:hypothetical protein
MEQELTGIMIRVNSTIDPYARFVRLEKRRLEETSDRIIAIKEELRQLRTAIKASTSTFRLF